ncbi:DNA modification methylase [Paenibacillus spongiae]|uniref:DNA modification methylase n=1 Tax=Paenibacillus spongiae TaxID=2909671 RepID=A0ABY5S5R5_9BACL|nr:DNA modification methylase [Paenibacillus spongiae]UVI28180.1 DNA modification methylase [Paenibacillus spongiae]
MKIEKIRHGDLKPNEWNPNTMEDHIFHSLVESIRRYGVLQPILVRSDLTIIKGEKRWKAAQIAGIEEMICVIVQSSEEEAKLLNISLSHLRGKTDEELLASLVTELSLHFHIDDLSNHTGYSVDELNRIIEELPNDISVPVLVEDDGFDVNKALDTIREPITKRGDVWALGRHILMCGDSTSINDVQRLLGSNKASLVVTDPPYNVAFESDSARLQEDGRGSIMNDNMTANEFDNFLCMVFSNYASIMDPKAAIYVFHASSYQRAFENAMNAFGIRVRTQCVWVKNASSFGFAQYKFKHEPVFYGHLKGKSPAWYGDRKQTTIWRAGLPIEDPSPETVWEVSRGDVNKYVHPTQKPLDLLAIPIGNSSKGGDIVVDLFGGSGSTLMTCEQMGRTCFTMELDPIFCDVILKRFRESTGTEPNLLSSDELVV